MNYYTIYYSDRVNKTPIKINTGTINYATSLGLVGPNAPGYGTVIATNFLNLLENFANATSPSNPIEGQLWYDTSNVDDKKLKILDNATWYPINGIHQQPDEPTNVKVGDIWVDTTSLQLKIASSPGNWVKVGADFSLGSQTGSENISIAGTDGNTHPVIVSFLNGDVISILAKESFKPLSVIDGFDNLIPGLNLSTKLYNSVIPKLLGNATEASSLRVTVPASQAVSANFFLRKDIPQSLNESLVIDNNIGLRIGKTTPTFLLQKSENDGSIFSISPGSKIKLSINDLNNVPQTLFTVDGGTQRVGIGIANINPTASLDVLGTMKVSNATTMSSSLLVVGPLQTNNNLTVLGSVSVSSVSTFTNSIYSQNIVPITGSTYDLGSANKKFKNIWADAIGSTSTQFNGNSGSATKLALAKTFQIAGQVVTTADQSFNGTQNVVLTSKLSYKSIAEQVSTSTVGSEFTIAVSTGTSLYKATKSNFLADITPRTASSGMILAWAGTLLPTGWVSCDGTSYNQSGDYNSLYSVIGTTYGSTAPATFQVPNLTPLTANGSVTIRYIIKV
jgi:hypothetical protein